MDDSQLASLAGQGDPNAWRTLFERYQRPVYNFVYRMVDNAEDAADIVQNSFIKVFTALGERDISNFSAYLYRTARNLAYDEIRRRQRFADVDHEILAPEDPNIYADPQRALMLGEQIDTVRRAVGNLSENHRAALMLRELQELDYDEMAEVLESNRNAVGALLSRARLRFREELRMAQVQTEAVPPECEEIIALLSPYIDNELPEAATARVEAHCADCTFCAAALDEMQEASRSFRILIPVIPPTDVAQAVTRHMDGLSAQESGNALSLSQSPGAGDAPQPTSGAAGAGSSRLLQILKNKFLWAGAGAVLIFVCGALLLAEDSGDHETGSTPAVVATTGTTTRPRTATTPTATATVPTVTDEAGAETDAAANEPTATTTEVTPAVTATTITTPPSNVDISSGYLYPSPAYDTRPVTFQVYVTGGVVNVAIRAVNVRTGAIAADYGLTLNGADRAGELWSGSRTLTSGKYDVYAVATGTDGIVVTQLIQVLDVIATVR